MEKAPPVITPHGQDSGEKVKPCERSMLDGISA
jgi:hypothetical protein